MGYVARVELVGYPTSEDYENLHAAMKRAGFARTIAGDGGALYRLPNGTYQSASYASAISARDAAQSAAQSVWTDVLVIVSGSATAWWLKPA